MNDIQTVVQILAKLLVGKFRVKVSLGGRDDSYIDCRIHAVGADALNVAVLQESKERRLHWQAHFADFVEEHRAAMRLSKASDSRTLSGTPAQLIAMNGASRRRPCWWMSLATTSFPTPLSPVMRTLASDRAAHSSSCWISCMAADDPMSRCREDILNAGSAKEARTLAPYSPDVNIWTHAVRASVYF